VQAKFCWYCQYKNKAIAMTSSIIKNMAKVRGRYNSNNHDALKTRLGLF
jgi:hypothetical protein